MRHTTVRLLVAALTGLTIVGAASLPPAGALSDVGFLASASAQGFRSTYVVPGQFVVEQIWDYGGPIAQSQLDPSGGAAYGSLPFPGEAAIVAPGLIANLAGLPSPPRSYPFYASAQYPSTPSSDVSDPSGNYSLAAQADAVSAAATALSRGGTKDASIASSESHSDIQNTADAVVARAETVSKGLSFGAGALTIGAAVATSESKLVPGQPVERSAKLTLTGVQVAGTPVGMGPGGIDDKAANDALKAAGISVRIARQAQGDSGATADVLEVTVQHPLPGGDGQGTMIYRFGGASTRIATGTAAEESATADPSSPPTESPAGSAAPRFAPAVTRMSGVTRMPREI
jgi:hypothetical protein